MAMDWGADPSATGGAGAPAPDPAMDQVIAAIGALGESDPAGLSAEGCGQRVRRVEQAVAMLHAHQAACVGVMQARGDAQTLGYRTTQAWLRVGARIAPGAAKGLTALAGRLPDRAAVADSFAAGRISLPHAQVIARAVAEIGPHLAGPDDVAKVETSLVELAEQADPLTLSRACRRLRIQAAPQPAGDDDWDAFAQRELSLSPTFAGMTAISGTLDPLSAETVMTAIHAFAAPTGGDDPRTAGQRRADALVEICHRVLTGGQAPVNGGLRPHVTVVVPLATLEERADAQPGELTWTGPVSPQLVQRILCDAAVTRIIVDGHSQPLDVGRATRVVPTGLRRAVMIRDRHCQWPGCDVPAAWCDCHHITAWSRGGRTRLTNLITLCGHHHNRLHMDRLAIIRHPDRRTELIPDPHHDNDGDHPKRRRNGS